MSGANSQQMARQYWISAYPFEPTNSGLGVSLTCSTSSARAELVGRGNVLSIYNAGPNTVHCVIGGSSIEATTAGYPVRAGTSRDISITDETTHLAAITESGAARLVINRGFGNSSSGGI